MITATIKGYKRILRKIRSRNILNGILSGKTTYFENPVEEIAFKYIPGQSGGPGKYYAKYYGRNESEINFDSTSILMGVMEGKKITKARYERYHLIESVIWNRKINTPAMEKTMSKRWVYI
jgi:hypothetical protein